MESLIFNFSVIAAIILGAGKGTRINSKTINKVTLPFLGRPLINYAVDLFQDVAAKIAVVVGAFSESVKEAIGRNKKVIFAYQKKRLGTAHAVKLGLLTLEKYRPDLILVGMGDHMMFYKQETVKKLIDTHKKENAVISFYTTKYHKPDKLAWGRVVRNRKGDVLDIIEQKDADEKQRKIKELNAGFYCFDFNFLKKNLNRIKKSEATGEYYLTDLIKIAVSNGIKIVGMPVRFREIGIGVNRQDELAQSQSLYKRFRNR